METVLLTLVTLSLVLAGIFFFRRNENFTADTVGRFRKPNDPDVEWDEKNYNDWLGNPS
tara:strand:+ start:610 stop:786 length:177 start_codon:yes stop_codon:yes gene_type:complete